MELSNTDNTETFSQNLTHRAIIFRSKQIIILTGSETEKEAKESAKLPVFIPSMSIMKDVHTQRVQMKQKLAAGFRLLAKFGWDEGVAGHMTCRDPEYPDLFWVNAFGQYFGHIKASDLILIDHEGSIVRGQRPVNKAAFAIHSAIHQVRTDVVCAVHTHSIYGRTFSTFGRKLLSINQDACAFYDCHNVYENFGGVVFDKEEGERLVKALGPTNKYLILQNHGLLTTGKTVDAAIWAFISMEKCCHSQLLAEASHVNGYKDLDVIDGDIAKETYNTVGDDKGGYLKYQPMYEMIIKEQPDCLE